MFFSPHLSGKRLSDLCHRLATGLAAGVDIRKVWKREAENAPGRMREQFQSVQHDIEQGEPFATSLAKTGNLFPRLFLQMVDVGERTGQTAEVLNKLERHYRVRHELMRTFLGLLAWPMIQLIMAVFIIGLLIWILGALDARDLDGKPIDPLGIGLIGTRGVIIYANLVLATTLAIAAAVAAMRRGALWLRPVQRFVTKLPGIGSAIQKICLAQLAWTLHLLLNVEMDLRQLVPLVLLSTGNDYYIQHRKQMVADVQAGLPLHLAFANSGAFPPTFLDALAVAEESGQISESMARLANQYEAEAESAMKYLAVAAGIAVWVLVATLIVLMIFRLFIVFYLGPIKQATEMTM
ncbi:type II secretion system F family protein [Aeoliella sp. ICT_H6.2]|uniref:Type II secretion system F family protein n=1 Tax=Aeoliella straminimaris TaxID=2954799 RepID=A0A9X2FGM1_9BACT|nr:type II secretion system F family protein [Aeoliella straminimaris]MCO6048048.1 type II secretion system F family protein [Aeoliella straminimaris]